MTPDVTARRCCGGSNDRDEDNRCDVDSAQWTTPTWSALNFEMKGQHYFGYTFSSAGVGQAAIVTATANADLDCDTSLSTFERYGYAAVGAGDLGDCVFQGASALYKSRPPE